MNQNSHPFSDEQVMDLLSLVDGAKGTVELYKPQSPSQIVWRENWLKKAREILGWYDGYINENIHAELKAESKLKKQLKKLSKRTL
jgi:hypothetical protein